MNLDQLGGRKLPSIDAQIFNFLNRIRRQVGDEEMETVHVGVRNALARITGVIDGDRVDDLLDLASERGVVEFVPDDCFRIALTGWRPFRVTEAEPHHQLSSEAPHMQRQTVKVDCNECGPTRNADIRASYSISGVDADGASNDSSTTPILPDLCGKQRLPGKVEAVQGAVNDGR